MRKFVSELLSRVERGEEIACCTVVATRGSTPQEAGAMMLVRSDGSQVGTLGGGCVEAEVRQRALHALAAGAVAPELHEFDLDGDQGWDDGLICGGRMTALIETMSPERADYFRHLGQLLERGVGGVQAVVLSGNGQALPAGARALFDDDGRTVVATGRAAAWAAEAPVHPPRARPAVVRDIAWIPVRPRIRLLIVGAGHVGQAVARLATETDFEVWVIDDREKYANAERCPTAERLVIGDIGPTVQSLLPTIGHSTFCLIVTRGHIHDEEALFHLAGSAAGYIGMIGSKRKVRLTYEDLLGRGVSQAALDRVHAPVGMEIGSQTVPEIAVSIVAELIAVRNGARGGTMAAGNQS